MALVGIESDAIFSTEFLEHLQQVTKNLRETQGINYVLSLTNVADFTVDEVNGGIITASLVDTVPTTQKGLSELREKVFAREQVVGNLISADAKAVLIYCFLAYGTDPRAISAQIRSVVTTSFPDKQIYWGGNPFISSYVYDTVQKDLRRLSPWAVIVIILLMILSLKNVIGTLLALLSTGLAIGITVGLMAAFGVKLNLMLGSMPIVLFAVGCAYSIHFLMRYFDWRKNLDCETALVRTVSGIGPVVLAAGITSAAAIMSFIVMDIKPIQEFGLFLGIGILIAMVLALTFVPAVIRLYNLNHKVSEHTGWSRRLMVRLALFSQSYRLPVGVALVLVTVVCGVLVTRIKTDVDQRSFFAAGSPPDQADKFLRDHFKAAQFIQILVNGDMSDPAVLREMQSLADRLEQVPHISGAQHIGQVIAKINQAMNGQKRIPDTREQINNLFMFLAGDPSVGQLVTEDHQQALIQIKVDTSRGADIAAVLAAIQHLIDAEHLDRYEVATIDGPRANEVRARKLDELIWRLQTLARSAEVSLPAESRSKVRTFLASDTQVVDRQQVAVEIERYLRSSESPIELSPDQKRGDSIGVLARVLTKLGERPSLVDLRSALATAFGRSPDNQMVADWSTALVAPLQEIWIRLRASERAHNLIGILGLGPPSTGTIATTLNIDVAMALMEADLPARLLPAVIGVAASSLSMQVSGLPVLHRGLAQSVQRNQLWSLLVALVLVVLILSVMFKSAKTGIMAATPTLFALIVIHGAMGWLQISLDIGTSLLGSLILANSVDYAVHLIASWRSQENESLRHAAAYAADQSGPAIWTTAATMFVGFFVLALGEAKPLQNVASLKATAMLVSALATFLVVPVLARKRRYQILNDSYQATEPSAAVEAELIQSTTNNR